MSVLIPAVRYRIKECREKAEKSQSELAQLIGTSQHVISEYENGKYKPTNERLALICKVLECKLSDIMVMDEG